MAAQAPLVLRTAAEADVETPGADRIGLFPKSDAAIPGEPHWIDDGGTVRSLQGTDGVLTYQNHGNTGASEDIDAGTNVHRLVFNAATVALTTSGWPASGTPGIVRLLLVQDGVGGRLADWSGITGLVWGAAGAPTLQTGAGEIDVVDLQSYDGGTTILGSYEIGAGTVDAVDVTADTTGYGNSSGSDVQEVLDDFDAAITAAAGGAVTFCGAKAYTTGVAISNAVITFASEIYDTDSIHDTSSATSRMTIPAGKSGYWEFKASGFSSRADARLSFYVGGAIVRGGNASGATANNYASASIVLNLSAGDYVEIFANTVASTTFGDNTNIGDNFTFTATFLGA